MIGLAELFRRTVRTARARVAAWGARVAQRAHFARRRREPLAHQTGRWGEQVAERMLKDEGYRILGRRVRLSARDELDLVARRDDVLVFVEVKTRRTEDYGRPVAALTRGKRRAMTRAAIRYLRRLKAKPPYIRFDVVEVVGDCHSDTPAVRHIENCFTIDRPRCIWW